MKLVFFIPRYRSGEIPSSLVLLGFARSSLAKLRQAQDDREGYSQMG
ncbi:MAG: hypothetical protein IJE25_09570 [Clostridia bacterium]|nr:hypothetical protein [Clostridia bacterium]